MAPLPLNLSASYFGNPLSQYFWALFAAVVSAVIFSWIQKLLIWRFEQWTVSSANTIDDAILTMVTAIRPPFYWFLSLYIGIKMLSLPDIVVAIVNGLMLAWVLYFAVRAASKALELILTRGVKNEGERAARHLLIVMGNICLWIFAFLLLLQNVGINITSLIAGLGIGGIAIAFALQNILADLFSSFAIYLDKPFEAGDFIIVGAEMGTVERVGIKTTRLAALTGEEISIANRDLTSARVHNYKRMRERRIQMDFGITYETPAPTLAALPPLIRKMLSNIEGIRVDRVHFAGFGASSLDFQMVYYVTSADYNQYMDRQQEINLGLVELFAQEKVSFAYPTRMIYTAKA